MTILGIFGATSCSDMLETDSSRQVFDPELDAKTDSMFYAFGVMQAFQQLGDQYVLQGEMRGELVSETDYTDVNLRRLMNFDFTEANTYDSAYVYYRVINNCNYYIAHRDTTLSTGSVNVSMKEYVAIKAFRAWAYLQLARNYGSVPFFTEPLLSVSQINGSNFPKKDIKGIAEALGPDLSQYTGTPVPILDGDPVAVGGFNYGGTKNIRRTLCFIPVDVILGELYLEAGDYANAATYYTNFLISTKKPASFITTYPDDFFAYDLPSDFDNSNMSKFWRTGFVVEGMYQNDPTTDIITYIPMAVNRLRGVTSDLPKMFGYDMYATSASENSIDEVQIIPSDVYTEMTDTADYYYFREATGIQPLSSVGSVKWGDMRVIASVTETGDDTDPVIRMSKYRYGNIVLYRYSMIYLHLAEALNRLGYPDAAFAILKEGINEQIISNNDLVIEQGAEEDDADFYERSKMKYITDETVKMFTDIYPFLSDENRSTFTSGTCYGIHQHGAGVTSDGNYPGRSPYKFVDIVGAKMNYIKDTYNVPVGATKQDTINAIEDLLCDEYALEFAFEGRRFYDLCRLARHKNGEGTGQYAGSPEGYSANFGGRWLAKKLESKNLAIDLTDENSWYLPFTRK